MKFGKTYMETMADPSFPKEWREGAIEYKHLKKLINGVVAELESLGLGADVLRELIVHHNEDGEKVGSPRREASTSSYLDPSDGAHPKLSTDSSSTITTDAVHRGRRSASQDSGHLTDDETPAERWLSNFTPAQIRSSSASRSQSSRPSSSSSSRSASQSQEAKANKSNGHSSLEPPHHPSARRASHASGDRLLSPPKDPRRHGEYEDIDEHDEVEWHGLGRKDLEAIRARNSSVGDGPRKPRKSEPSPGRHDWGGLKWREMAKPEWDPVHPVQTAPAPEPTAADDKAAKVKWVEGKSGRRARAEYELGGTREHPIPRIRLFIESPLASEDEDGVFEEEEDENDSFDGPDTLPASPTLAKIVQLPASPPKRSNTIPVDGPEGETAEEKHKRQSEIRQKRGVHTREIVIPLTADTQFLDTLTGALQNLSSIQGSQRDTFVAETESLCSAVARAASPYASKNDLYVWREIFSLWVDFQIFESQRERDRGELSIDESEARLKRFADELAKRGWMASEAEQSSSAFKGRLIKRKTGSGPSSQGLSNVKSAKAMEDFLKLNVALLDVKKFQRVNVEAARKILKKHDKRTALTASSDLRMFMAQQEASRGASGIIELPASALGMGESMALTATGASGHPSLAALLPSSTTGLLSESLPHILLSLVTTTLLPILPSVDDYSCAICTSVAWRPVRLDCSHLFCIRCLVKLQKKGKDDCPLCRCPNAVKTADGGNMDEAAVNFLKLWFPKEVEEKSQENEAERTKEEMQELGLVESERCVVC